jgi:hypothetical protein
MSDQAMRLINRDESRHIAIDYHMTDYYTSDEYTARLAERPSQSLDESLRGAKALGLMLYYGKPFFREVFFAPMDLVDPTGKRILEAFKRVQFVSAKPGIARRPFGAFMLTLQNAYKNPLGRKLLGRVLTRLAGMEPRFMEQIPTDEELARAGKMTFDELAQEALAVKDQPS